MHNQWNNLWLSSFFKKKLKTIKITQIESNSKYNSIAVVNYDSELEAIMEILGQIKESEIEMLDQLLLQVLSKPTHISDLSSVTRMVSLARML